MRGEDRQQEAMFSYVSPERRVPADHPLRPIRAMGDGILKKRPPRFAKRYSDLGRPSIAPERRVRLLLRQIFYAVRSARLLLEPREYPLLFRCLVGMEMDEAVCHHAGFSKNRERLLNEEIAEAFFNRVLAQAQPYLSDEHCTVDGTLLEAWASPQSFRRKDGPAGEPGGAVNFHGEKRSHETPPSRTAPEARLFQKSKGAEAKWSYLGPLRVENRNGRVVRTRVRPAHGRAEREAGLRRAKKIRRSNRVTLGGDKNYDTRDFVEKLWRLQSTPHVAQNDAHRSSAIDPRTTRPPGYQVSPQKRQRVEQPFRWRKVIGRLKKVKWRGLQKVGWRFTCSGAAYNLCRLQRLQAQVVV